MMKRILALLLILFMISLSFASCDKSEEQNQSTSTLSSSTEDENGIDNPPPKNYSSTTVENWIEAFAFLNNENVKVSYNYFTKEGDGSYSKNEYGVIKRYNEVICETKLEQVINGEKQETSDSDVKYINVEICSWGIVTKYSSVINHIKSYVVSGEDCGFNSFVYDESEKCYIKNMDTESKTKAVKVYFENNTLDKVEYMQTSLKNGDIQNESYVFYPVEEIAFPKEEAIGRVNNAMNMLSSVKSVSCTSSFGYTTDATTEEIVSAVSSLLSSLSLDNPSYYSVNETVYFECDNTPVDFLDTSFNCGSIQISFNENGITYIMLPGNDYMQIRLEY